MGKKVTMSLTGLFLVSFLAVHASINALIFYNDGGATFNIGAHFMGTNPVIRTIEIVLVVLLLMHIVQGLRLWNTNRRARKIRYAVIRKSPKVTWYSTSMTLLGTLILFFLVVHTSYFWIPNRTHQFIHGEELPLYEMMLAKFSNPFNVLLYLGGVFSLFWHLLHGFASAFRSLGLHNSRYIRLVQQVSLAFSISICLVFAAMPVSMYFGWIR